MTIGPTFDKMATNPNLETPGKAITWGQRKICGKNNSVANN